MTASATRPSSQNPLYEEAFRAKIGAKLPLIASGNAGYHYSLEDLLSLLDGRIGNFIVEHHLTIPGEADRTTCAHITSRLRRRSDYTLSNPSEKAPRSLATVKTDLSLVGRRIETGQQYVRRETWNNANAYLAQSYEPPHYEPTLPTWLEADITPQQWDRLRSDIIGFAERITTIYAS